jgi:hypothetical protein
MAYDLDGVPDELPVWSDGRTDSQTPGQPPVVGLVGGQHRIRADRLPQLGDDAVRRGEPVAGLVVRQVALRLESPFNP